jgi:4-alpha-glucanotransferase
MINQNLTEIIKSKKRAGVSFPLFSLFNKKSFAVGDIYSLEVLGEWAQKTGITIIQILPLNDLGFGRSPYSSISAFAIDPVYISLYLLGIEDLDLNIQNRIDDKVKIKERKLKILKEHFNKIINDENSLFKNILMTILSQCRLKNKFSNNRSKLNIQNFIFFSEIIN